MIDVIPRYTAIGRLEHLKRDLEVVRQLVHGAGSGARGGAAVPALDHDEVAVAVLSGEDTKLAHTTAVMQCAKVNLTRPSVARRICELYR